MQRPPIASRSDLGIGLSRFGECLRLEQRHHAVERRVEPREAREVDLGQARGRHLARPEQRRQPVRGQEREVVLGGRHGPGPRRWRVRRASECRNTPFLDQSLEQRARSAGPGLELTRQGLAVAERERRRCRRRPRRRRRRRLCTGRVGAADIRGAGSRKGRHRERASISGRHRRHRRSARQAPLLVRRQTLNVRRQASSVTDEPGPVDACRHP